MNDVPTFQGWLTDGRRAARQPVAVVVGASGLVLVHEEDGSRRHWSYATLSRPDDGSATPALRLALGEARLTVEDPAFRSALFAAAPRLKAASLLRRACWVAGTATAAPLIAVAVWWGVPRLADGVARAIPSSWEAELGDRVMAALPGRRCTTPQGQAAMDDLMRRLTQGVSMPVTPTVTVLDHPESNALALPGGRLILLTGLIREAQSLDEVAGVLAHEVTHARHHHPTAMLLRRLGLSMAAFLWTGDLSTGIGVAGSFLLLTYSREQERDADSGAVELLTAAGLDPAGFARFLDRAATKEAQGMSIPGYLSSHPASAERAAAVRAARAASRDTAPSEDAVWAAIRAICPHE